MSARNKKERKKQKRTKRKRREMMHRERRQMQAKRASDGESLRLDVPAISKDPPAWQQAIAEVCRTNDIEGNMPVDSKQDDDPLGIWWREYDAADGAIRLQMVREKLEIVPADDEDCERFFPEAIDELQMKLSSEKFVAFLEELCTAHPAIFAMSADWHTKSMVSEYLAQNRMQDVDRVVMALAEGMEEIGDPFFGLVSTIRLAGRTNAAQAMINAASALLDDSNLMQWAVSDILSWALFPHYQRCVAAGAAGESIEALHDAARSLGIQDAKKYQDNRRNFALRLSGQSTKRWTQTELIGGEDDSAHKIYLLGADFMRWLCKERQFDPMVADELRGLVNGAIDGLDCPFNTILLGLTRRNFEPLIASKLAFMSLKRIHAPATIVAMKHYFNFLREVELTTPDDWQKSQSACDSLWKTLQETLKDEWRQYRFLEAYLPAS